MEGGGSRVSPLNSIVSVYLFSLVLSLLFFQSVIFSLLTPLPQMFCYLRLGRWAGISMPFVMVLVAGFAGGGAGLGYLFQFAMPGVIFSEAIVRRCSVEKSFLLALGATAAAIMIFLSLYASGRGLSSGELVGAVVQSGIDQVVAFNEEAGGSQEQLRALKKLSPSAAEFASRADCDHRHGHTLVEYAGSLTDYEAPWRRSALWRFVPMAGS